MKRFKDYIKEELNFDRIKEEGNFTENEINILEDSEFEVNGDVANGVDGDIKIKIEKDHESKENGVYNNVMYTWTLIYNGTELESGWESTLNGTLRYLSRNLNSYAEQVKRYQREKESYDGSSRIKKFFTFKPSLIEVDDDGGEI